jgi:hypothetical protein
MATNKKKPTAKAKQSPSLSKSSPTAASTTAQTSLLTELRDLIVDARQRVAREVNSALVLLYWQIGARIRKDILQEQRAEYGQEIVPTLSAQLAPEFGQGFSKSNLLRMIQFAEAFPQQEIVATVSRQLGWSHVIWFPVLSHRSKIRMGLRVKPEGDEPECFAQVNEESILLSCCR